MRAALTRRMKLLEEAKEVHKTEVHWFHKCPHPHVRFLRFEIPWLQVLNSKPVALFRSRLKIKSFSP